MKIIRALRGTIAAALFCVSPALLAVELVPVISGLAGPVFVGHAGDGSNRLFVEEQRGVIRVVQPGASTSTVFLDIPSKVVSGGEQ
jgi:hypothetical protein